MNFADCLSFLARLRQVARQHFLISKVCFGVVDLPLSCSSNRASVVSANEQVDPNERILGVHVAKGNLSEKMLVHLLSSRQRRGFSTPDWHAWWCHGQPLRVRSHGAILRCVGTCNRATRTYFSVCPLSQFFGFTASTSLRESLKMGFSHSEGLFAGTAPRSQLGRSRPEARAPGGASRAYEAAFGQFKRSGQLPGAHRSAFNPSPRRSRVRPAWWPTALSTAPITSVIWTRQGQNSSRACQGRSKLWP